MYGIIEIREEDHSKKLVAFVDTPEQFVTHVKNLIGDEYTTMEKLSYQDFSKSKTFKQGRYLLVNGTIILLEKKEILKEGYIYNTVSRYLNIIKTWELIAINCDFPLQLDTIISSPVTIQPELNNNIMFIPTNQILKEKIQHETNNIFIPTKQIFDEPIQPIEIKTEQPELSDIDKLIDAVLSEQGTYDEYDAINTYERINAPDIEEHASILVIGKRGSGRSTVVSSILNKYSEDFLTNSLIISPNERLTPFYKNKFPSTRIETEYKQDFIEEYLNAGSGAIILDNCLAGVKSWKNDLYLMELIHHAKYYNKLLIFVSSFPFGFDQDTRNSFDYVFLLQEDFFSNQKRMYDHYAGMYETFDLFRNDFVNLTKNFNAMVINQNSGKNNNDQISWYNAIYNYNNVFKLKID